MLTQTKCTPYRSANWRATNDGGEGGIDDARPCASPLRGRFAVQIGCPADLSNRWLRTYTLSQKKRAEMARCFLAERVGFEPTKGY